VGLYFYFHVARRVFDPNKDNCFISGAPQNTGVHSSVMEMFFTRIYNIVPELSARPDWYTQAFSCTGAPITGAQFYEPADVIRDLERITEEMLARHARLPVSYRLRIGNKANITECVPSHSVDIWLGGEPCTIRSDWNEVSIWSQTGKLRDITAMKTLECRLRKKSMAACKNEPGQVDDGVNATVYIEPQSFASRMRPYLFDLFTPCDWAREHGLLLFPMWT
jgi:hypothetical protein